MPLEAAQEMQCRLGNQLSHFLSGTKTQGSGFRAQRLPCVLGVGSDLIVPLKAAAVCNLHIKRPPLFTRTPELWEGGWVNCRALLNMKRHLWFQNHVWGALSKGIVLHTKLRVPFIVSARLL